MDAHSLNTGEEDRERILSQLLLLQGTMHVLPTVERLVEFAQRAIRSVPGVSCVHICTAGRPNPPRESVAAICDVCEIGKNASEAIIRASCGLKDTRFLRSILVRTQTGPYGYLNVCVDDENRFAPYAHYIENAANVLATNIENLVYKMQMERANKSLRREVTERKSTEEELTHSHGLMRYIIEHDRSAIAVFDRDMKYIYVSQRYLNDYKVKEKDVIGKHHYDVFPDLPQKVRDVHQKALAGEIISAEDDPFKRDDGTVDWTRWECRPWYEANGSIGGIILYTEVITERKKAEEKIKALLREKEILLKEVHHRIKNNMSSIMSLLSLQSNALKNPEAVAALLEARTRLRSMGVLYDKLYRSENLREMSIKDYLPPLVDEILGVFPNRGLVKVEKRVEDIVLGVKILLPLGIIVNELITNARKYAFVGRESGLIIVSASAKDGRVTLIVEDDGIGIPESVDIANSNGFGLQLIGMLTAQLDGAVRIDRRKGGARFVLEFNA